MSSQPTSSHDSLALAARIDALCDHFEEALLQGVAGDLANWLPTNEPDRGAALPELARLELEHRRRQNEPALAAEYFARFPELAADPQWLAMVHATERFVSAESPSLTAPGPRVASDSGLRSTQIGRRVRCPHCQNPISLADEHLGEVLCPGCGTTFSLRNALPTSSLAPTKPLGKFQLLERVGLGGFGAVWKARDTTLDRLVALKIPNSGLLTREEERERFQREARAAAQLRHPGIVPVHEVAILDGLPVIVSDFVTGVSLRDLLEAQRPTFRDAAALLATVSESVHYAHTMGVVHRDLKPGNIMIPYGTVDGPTNRKTARLDGPLVMDFGLALRTDAEATLTREGAILGTPAYMSPEQAEGRGHQADGRTDVWGLGVILYELLSGELPFRGSVVMIQMQVLHDDPRPPRRLNDAIPRDLEIICLKCLQKEPVRRYPSAAELAADLRRFLEGEPIHARPMGHWERACRWVRRRPAATALIGVSLLGILLLLGLGLWFSVQLGAAEGAREAANTRAEAARQQGELQDFFALLGTIRERTARPFPGWTRENLKSLAQAAKLGPVADHKDTLRTEAVATLSGVDPAVYSDFENITALAFHPDGRQVAVGLGDGTVTMRGVATGKELARLRSDDSSKIFTLVLGADGRTLVTGDWKNTLRIWKRDETGIWRCLPRRLSPEKPKIFVQGYPVSASVSLDGRLMAACCGHADAATLWNPNTGEKVADYRAPAGERLRRLALSLDGNILAVGYHAGTTSGILVWDVTRPGPPRKLTSNSDAIQEVAFSPDGKLLAGAFINSVEVYETSTLRRQLFVGGDYPFRIRFSPDSRLLAVPDSQLGVVRLWNVVTNREVAALKHPGDLSFVEFSPDGKTLVSADHRALRVWNLAGSSEKIVLPGHSGGLTAIAYHPEGKWLVSCGKDRLVRVWDPVEGQLLRANAGFRGVLQALAFNSDGSTLATADYSGDLRFWDTMSWKEWLSLEHPKDHGAGQELESLAFHRDNYFAAGGDGGLSLWQILAENPGAKPGFRLVRQPLPNMAREDVRCLTFSKDGRFLAFAGDNHALRLLDLSEGKGRRVPGISLASSVYSFGFHSDGEHVVGVGETGSIGMWDISRGQPTALFRNARRGERREEFSMDSSILALSPDSELLARQQGRSVELWDVPRRALLLALPEGTSTVWALAWSPGGDRLAVGSAEGGLVIWNLAYLRGRLEAIGLGW